MPVDNYLSQPCTLVNSNFPRESSKNRAGRLSILTTKQTCKPTRNEPAPACLSAGQYNQSMKQHKDAAACKWSNI